RKNDSFINNMLYSSMASRERKPTGIFDCDLRLGLGSSDALLAIGHRPSSLPTAACAGCLLGRSGSGRSRSEGKQPQPGRAVSAVEAPLWTGGEPASDGDGVRRLGPDERLHSFQQGRALAQLLQEQRVDCRFLAGAEIQSIGQFHREEFGEQGSVVSLLD